MNLSDSCLQNSFFVLCPLFFAVAFGGVLTNNIEQKAKDKELRTKNVFGPGFWTNFVVIDSCA